MSSALLLFRPLMGWIVATHTVEGNQSSLIQMLIIQKSFTDSHRNVLFEHSVASGADILLETHDIDVSAGPAGRFQPGDTARS